jgi:hypothetical protein
MLKPTKAALFGIHVRFADMERRSKKQGKIETQGPVKMTTFLPSRTNDETSYSLEGLHKHRMPISLDRFKR